MFQPRWIPESLDPELERLKRLRAIAGLVTAVGVYTLVAGGFDMDEALENILVASASLLLVTPVTALVMLLVWRRSAPVGVLRRPLLRSLNLLLRFVGSVLLAWLLLVEGAQFGLAVLLLAPLAFWMLAFVAVGAVRLQQNFFGTAAVHRCLPPLLASVIAWMTAVPDLVTGDLKGMGVAVGTVFILGGPVTVTLLATVEFRRLKRLHRIRLGVHPAHLPPAPPRPQPAPPRW